MPVRSELDDEQAYWLRRVLETRPRIGAREMVNIPDPVHDTLVDKGFIRRREELVEITLDGINAIARYKPFRDPEELHRG